LAFVCVLAAPATPASAHAGLIGASPAQNSVVAAAPVQVVLTWTESVLHISAMSVWLGGLIMLILFLLPKANPTELAAIVPVWSRWALYAVSVLVLTGLAQAIVLVRTLDALVTSTYGWLLLVKVTLVLAILAIAAQSRRMVGPLANRADGAGRRLRSLVIAEAAGAIVVLGLTSVLVQTTPASTATQSAPTSQSATMRSPLFTLSIDIEPAAVGENQIHLYANTPDRLEATVIEWHVSAFNPAQGIEAIDAQVLPISGSHAIASIGLPSAGTWTFRFDLRTTDKDEDQVLTDIQIAK
jgi:copper transport protein